MTATASPPRPALEADPLEPRPLYRLYPRQQEAMALLGFSLDPDERREPVEEMLYGGQAGGGKSLLARALAITVMTVWPQSETAIFRRTYPELEDSHIRPILRETAGTSFTYHEGKRELRAPNGSLCLFRYADDEKDLRHYLSAEWACLIVDEATAFPGDWLEFLRARVRSTRADWRPIILYTTNPGGVGHVYLKTQFVDPHPARTVWTAADEDGGLRRVFLPAALKDNPALGLEYRRRLLGIKDETIRRALMEGDWNIGGNFFFAEWRPTKHVIPDFPIPDHWRTRAIGVDFGFGAPWSCHFYVRDEDLWRAERETRWFVYRELYGAGVRDEEQARLIKEAIEADLGLTTKGGRRPKGRLPTYHLFCDPAMWSKNPNGLSVAEVYRFVLADHGVAPQKADNDRISGWQRVRDYLAEQADGWPALVYFASCTEAIRTLPALPRDRRNPEDADSDADDHAADELRYVLQGLGAPAQAIDHPGYEAHERAGSYRVRSSPGPTPARDGITLPTNARVPELLRAASQQGRFVPAPQDGSDRAMWARFAAAVRRANLGQARDPYGRLGGRSR